MPQNFILAHALKNQCPTNLHVAKFAKKKPVKLTQKSSQNEMTNKIKKRPPALEN